MDQINWIFMESNLFQRLFFFSHRLAQLPTPELLCVLQSTVFIFNSYSYVSCISLRLVKCFMLQFHLKKYVHTQVKFLNLM